MSLRDLSNMTKNQFNVELEYQEVEAKMQNQQEISGVYLMMGLGD